MELHEFSNLLFDLSGYKNRTEMREDLGICKTAMALGFPKAASAVAKAKKVERKGILKGISALLAEYDADTLKTALEYAKKKKQKQKKAASRQKPKKKTTTANKRRLQRKKRNRAK